MPATNGGCDAGEGVLPSARMDLPRGPCLLAFCAAPPRFEEAFRAELRGLGAPLLALTPATGMLFGADDEPRAVGPQPELWRLHGAGGAALTVVLLDEKHRVRLRREAPEAEGTLLAAVRSAGRAVRSAPRGIGRRELLVNSLAVALGAAVLQACAASRPIPGQQESGAAPALLDVTLVVNGQRRALQVEPRVVLLDALRENLGLTGTKKGCDMGQCGACTVLADGVRIDSCLALAAQYDGRSITTIEGLIKDGTLHPAQEAFLQEDAFQCGYCTPGQILSCIGFLHEGSGATDADIREGMSGNICRCGVYPNIVAAVRGLRGRT